MHSPNPYRKLQVRSQIKAWMQRNVRNHIDQYGEVDLTGLVEDWDRECASGGDTLDHFHPAWSIALQVAEELA